MRFTLALLGTLCLALPAAAQALPPLDSLAQLRVTSAVPRMRGTLLRADSASITVRTRSGDDLVMPLSTIRRLEVSEGRRELDERMIRGGITGFRVGAAAAVLMIAAGALIDSQSDCGDCYISATAAFAVLGAAVTAGGVVVGTTAGALTPSERWRTVLP